MPGMRIVIAPPVMDVGLIQQQGSLLARDPYEWDYRCQDTNNSGFKRQLSRAYTRQLNVNGSWGVETGQPLAANGSTNLPVLDASAGYIRPSGGGQSPAILHLLTRGKHETSKDCTYTCRSQLYCM
jgi:hypothetical protein